MERVWIVSFFSFIHTSSLFMLGNESSEGYSLSNATTGSSLLFHRVLLKSVNSRTRRHVSLPSRLQWFDWYAMDSLCMVDTALASQEIIKLRQTLSSSYNTIKNKQHHVFLVHLCKFVPPTPCEIICYPHLSEYIFLLHTAHSTYYPLTHTIHTTQSIITRANTTASFTW